MSDNSHSQRTFTDKVSGMSLDYPDNWSEGIEQEYPLLQNENGSIIFFIRKVESVLSANEMLGQFNLNFTESNERFGSFIRAGYEMTDYGKASVGGKDAVYIDLIMKGDEEEPDFKARLISIDHKNFSYGFYIVPEEDYDLFINEANRILESVKFP